jgi:hypothetical protein
MTHTILLGMGFEIKLIEGKKIIDLHIQGKKVKEGITVFPSKTGTNSKIIEGFLKLDRVPSRFYQDYISPDLPVVHKIGSRVGDPAKTVGFPKISDGNILLCGTNNQEILKVFQTLVNSLNNQNTNGTFIIDTHNEFNGLVRYYQQNPSSLRGKNLQLFQLGRNMHINLCDVVIPLSRSGEKLELKTIGAWKAYIIAQILLGSLTTSLYLTSRFAIPLETQIQRRATKGSASFTLNEVEFTLENESEIVTNENEENQPSQIEGIYADMMAVEQITGILEHFKAFPEVCYPQFTGHFSTTLARQGTITIFQFGSQSPIVKRAVVAFLLQFLSNTVKNQIIVFPHADEFLGQKTTYSRAQEQQVPTNFIDSCNTLAKNNVLILGSQSLAGLSRKLTSFDEIKNLVYLHLANSEDRDMIITKHQIYAGKNKWDSHQRIGIIEGEGLLFRHDTPSNIAYHFKLDKCDKIPVDLNPITPSEAKQRGSATLGLTPKNYHLLMKILKILYHGLYRASDGAKFVESEVDGELILKKFGSLDLYRESTEVGVSHWVMTPKGRDFYKSQLKTLSRIHTAIPSEERYGVIPRLKELEEYLDLTDSDPIKKETTGEVHNLLGSLLNLIFQISDSPPWNRFAEYSEIKQINGLEYPDFRSLFNLSASLANNLLVDFENLKKSLPDDVLRQKEVSSSITSPTSIKPLDEFLPTESLLELKSISKDLELEQYPENGIISIYFAFQKHYAKDMFVEIKNNLGDNNEK